MRGYSLAAPMTSASPSTMAKPNRQRACYAGTFFRREALCVDAYGKTAVLKKGSISVQKFAIHQIEIMRRMAKKISHAEGISHGHALDRLAEEKGLKNLSLLQKNGVLDPSLPQPYVFRRSDEGWPSRCTLFVPRGTGGGN